MAMWSDLNVSSITLHVKSVTMFGIHKEILIADGKDFDDFARVGNPLLITTTFEESIASKRFNHEYLFSLNPRINGH